MSILFRRSRGPERPYGPSGYPPMPHPEYLRRTQTDFDEFDKHNKDPYPKQGTPADEGWAIVEPPSKSEAQSTVDLPPVVPRSSQLIRAGFMQAGSRLVYSRLPDQYEQVGGVTVMRLGQYASPKAAASAVEAGRYYHELIERYGRDNVETCLDEMATTEDTESSRRRVAYYVRLGARIVEELPQVELATD